MRSGHYVAYIRGSGALNAALGGASAVSETGMEWHKMNDERVTDGHRLDEVIDNAYLLFLEPSTPAMRDYILKLQDCDRIFREEYGAEPSSVLAQIPETAGSEVHVHSDEFGKTIIAFILIFLSAPRLN